MSNKKNAQATINSIITYESRLLQISFNNYRFTINKLLQLMNYNSFTINKLLQMLAYAFFDHPIN